MHNNILTVVGITILVLCVSINPAIADNPIFYESKDDCSICHPINKPHLVRLKSLIDKLEINDNKLSVKYNYHPEVTEKYQELSDVINTLKTVLKPDNPYEDNPIICNFLWKLITLFISIFIPLENLYDKLLESKNLMLYYIVVISTLPISISYTIIAFLFVYIFDCVY